MKKAFVMKHLIASNYPAMALIEMRANFKLPEQNFFCHRFNHWTS